MTELHLIQKLIVWVPPVLFAITVHEVAHGWIARRLGDPTAMMLGRLTLNPFKHVDPIGTIVIPGLLLFLQAPFLFGWAKPVPVTYRNLRHPKRDMALVAIAGPAANLLMAILWAVLVKITLMMPQYAGEQMQLLVYMGFAGIGINVALMVLNLLPIPPLDGGRILISLLPGPWAWHVSRIEPYGFFIVIGLLMLGILQSILFLAQKTFFSILGL
uniref:Zn-dependent protease (Includes SpoIVFB) n=1 Tax=Candidatus Kentrum sp. FM TaxID=2126340 RepID=A0A450WQ79_9GAMM|nr:MAG: Zn-dependent protease (includes SpoIVFB) [Candidatus Kentron sp. FM]VFJ71863.1 MAG: Zn-dependent protease (includes SpoIVFB) [Candidatus Kentron sp. FM]VFK19213.1 MAG: Zn-dependent protease (includes SpoIVFB) [Candidatus Kentron sp. FM]